MNAENHRMYRIYAVVRVAGHMRLPLAQRAPELMVPAHFACMLFALRAENTHA